LALQALLISAHCNLGLRSRCSLQPRLSHCGLSALERRTDLPAARQQRPLERS